MQIRRSDKFGKIRYAGFSGEQRVTQWLASPAAVENQFVGRVREGRVDPRGLDEQMRSSILDELMEYDFYVDFDEDVSAAEQLALTLHEMRACGVPADLRMRFAQIATCTPEADTAWALNL